MCSNSQSNGDQDSSCLPPTGRYADALLTHTDREHYYGNATLAGPPACLLNLRQSVLIMTARSIAGLCLSENITDALASFHWLRHLTASSSNWRSLSTELFTALHLSTCQTGYSKSLICRRDVEAGCARRPPVSSTFCCRPTNLEQSTC